MRFPTVLQLTQSDCGPANIRAIARHYGVELKHETVRRICRNDHSGTSVAGLRRALEQLGFEAAARSIELDELRRYQKELLPAIAVIRNPGTGLLHYVTLVRLEKRRVWIMDPAHGLSAWELGEFLARWHRVEHEIPLEKIRDNNHDPANIAAVRRDLAALGVTEAGAGRLLTRLPLVDLDDRIRYVNWLAEQGLLKGIESPPRFLERLVDNPEPFPLPDHFVTIKREATAEQVKFTARGHVLVVVRPGPRLQAAHEPAPHPLRRLLGLALAERRLFAQILLAALAFALLGLALPVFLQLLIDHVLIERDPALLLYFVAGFAALQLCRQAFGLYRAYLLIRLSQKIDLRLMISYAAKLLRLKIRFFENRGTGDLTSRLQETFAIRDLVAGSALKVVFDLLFVAIALAVMALYDWRLMLAAAAVIPLYLAIVRLGGPPLRRAARQQMEDWAATQSTLIETVEGMKTVKLNTAEPATRARLDARFARWSRSWLRQSYAGLFADEAATLTAVLAVTALLYLGGLAVIDGRLTVGQLFAVHTMLMQLVAGLAGLVRANDEIQRAYATVDRLYEVLDSADEERDRENVMPRPEMAGAIELEDVSFSYTRGAPVLQGIGCTIAAGEEIVVVGESGAGKSTLVGLLARLYEPDSGTIRIDGHDLRDYALADLRRQLAVVAQDTFLFGDTLYNNIAFSRPDAGLDEVVAAARAACADEFIAALPERYESVVGERGIGLSGGQAKRVLLARALLARPAVLVLDEAFNGLDPTVMAAVKAGVREWMRGRTVIHITHDLRHAREADRVLVLERGLLVQAGSHAELTAQPGPYRRLHEDFERPQRSSPDAARAEAAE